MTRIVRLVPTATLAIFLPLVAGAQDSGSAAVTPAETASAASTQERASGPAASEWLRVYFELGSARIGTDQSDVLDIAARTFRDGDPYVMIVSGVADTVGSPATNLSLSLARAQAVVDALAARGIPVERLQVLGRGNSELVVDTDDDVQEPENRVVEISWR